ncbi:MAG TPA: hypothetical protein VF154_08925, partial [Terriglobales bacterium]
MKHPSLQWAAIQYPGWEGVNRIAEETVWVQRMEGKKRVLRSGALLSAAPELRMTFAEVAAAGQLNAGHPLKPKEGLSGPP